MEEALALMNPWWNNTPFNVGVNRERYLNPLLSSLEKKELAFFEEAPFSKKIIVQNYKDLQKLYTFTL